MSKIEELQAEKLELEIKYLKMQIESAKIKNNFLKAQTKLMEKKAKKNV